MSCGLTFRALRALLACLALASAGASAHASDERRIAIAVHGGAGVIAPAELTPEREASIRAALQAAVDAGYAVLEHGGSSLDAVTAAVRVLEDDPQFNAGRGAVLTHDGAAELDASIMDGHSLRAGAVAGVRHVKNPIELARLVMDKSPHVFLIGSGAEEFALAQGLTLVPNEYFRTPERERQLERAKQSERAGGAKTSATGTVGAVALDRDGNLAAATSTGGMTNKRHGRVGDSPIIGAGTYARNGVCAVSATGHGEYFIRLAVAHDICSLVAYRGLTLREAVREVLHVKLQGLGGDGGVIALDGEGSIVMDFNSPGMFRAARDSSGRREIAIYRDR
ncbi:MAG: isoaspartyl peptidase/L-asparaginase [Pseudomonadota bacterium]